jgi:hypothetical protein
MFILAAYVNEKILGIECSLHKLLTSEVSFCLLGHGGPLHESLPVFTAPPLHNFPPYLGVGLLHDLVRVLVLNPVPNCPLTVKTVGQELLILPEHLSSPSVFSGVPVTRSPVLCVFCRSLLYILPRTDDYGTILTTLGVSFIHHLQVRYNFSTLVFSVHTSLTSELQFCRSLFVLLYIFFRSLSCLSFFDIPILITRIITIYVHCR